MVSNPATGKELVLLLMQLTEKGKLEWSSDLQHLPALCVGEMLFISQGDRCLVLGDLADNSQLDLRTTLGDEALFQELWEMTRACGNLGTNLAFIDNFPWRSRRTVRADMSHLLIDKAFRLLSPPAAPASVILPGGWEW